MCIAAALLLLPVLVAPVGVLVLDAIAVRLCCRAIVEVVDGTGTGGVAASSTRTLRCASVCHKPQQLICTPLCFLTHRLTAHVTHLCDERWPRRPSRQDPHNAHHRGLPSRMGVWFLTSRRSRLPRFSLKNSRRLRLRVRARALRVSSSSSSQSVAEVSMEVDLDLVFKLALVLDWMMA